MEEQVDLVVALVDIMLLEEVEIQEDTHHLKEIQEAIQMRPLLIMEVAEAAALVDLVLLEIQAKEVLVDREYKQV
jgi:hypothetical protein